MLCDLAYAATPNLLTVLPVEKSLFEKALYVHYYSEPDTYKHKKGMNERINAIVAFAEAAAGVGNLFAATKEGSQRHTLH